MRHLFAETDPDTRAAHAATLDRVEQMAEPLTAARAAAMDRLKAELVAYILTQPIGTQLQAASFTVRLVERKVDTGALDLRCTGGLFLRLVRAGVLEQVGYGPNGGVAATGYNSTARPIYLVRSHDLSGLGWPMSEAGAAGAAA